MQNKIETSVKKIKYVNYYKKMIRDVANIIGISKSTIHNDMRKRLKSINNDLYLGINKLF